MFTIFNIINYMTGKYIPLSLLILITIGIYYYIIGYCFENVFSNNYYLISLLILMLLDITSLIIIFIYGDFSGSTDSEHSNSDKNNKKQKRNKKDKKDKKDNKDKKDKKNQIDNKNVTDCGPQCMIKNTNINDDKNQNPNHINKEIISLYDKGNPGSIHTFTKQFN